MPSRRRFPSQEQASRSSTDAAVGSAAMRRGAWTFSTKRHAVGGCWPKELPRPSPVGQHHAAFALVALRVVKPRQHAADVLVALVVSRTAHDGRRERHLGRGSEKVLQLLDRAKPCLVHVDHHPCDDQLPLRLLLTGAPSGSFLVGNTRPVQAHTTLDKAATAHQASGGTMAPGLHI